MFAGSLTPGGFVSLFEHIIPIKNAKKRYFLKGASGSGKGTFIKKIAAVYTAAGDNVDFFHCANDPQSLDGIAVPSHGFSIIDATLPHSHDPQLPGAIDEIIDFATFLDKEQVSKHIDEIIDLTKSKKQLFEEAQKYLDIAGYIYSQLHCKAVAWPSCGNNRKLFLSAITPDGIVDFADSFLDGYKIYDIAKYEDMRPLTETSPIPIISFHCPLAPSKIDYLVLPEERVALSAPDNLNSIEDSPLLHSALRSATHAMKEARAFHHKTEEIYIAAMDFAGVDEMAERIIANL